MGLQRGNCVQDASETEAKCGDQADHGCLEEATWPTKCDLRDRCHRDDNLLVSREGVCDLYTIRENGNRVIKDEGLLSLVSSHDIRKRSEMNIGKDE